jgi:serine/threonine protein phosphatase PrpC
MEDADSHFLGFAQNPKSAFFGVFDGHNGSSCSQYIAEKIPEKLSNLLENQEIETEISEIIETCYQQVDIDFLTMAQESNPVIEDGVSHDCNLLIII